MAVLSRNLLKETSLTWTQLSLIALGSFVVWVYVKRIAQWRRISKLGLTAPVIKTYVPLGLDMPVKACMYFLKNRAMDAWLNEWKKLGALKTLNYTMELRLLADVRVIMTADPQNIKAILTQQFSDYGKGMCLRLRWQNG